MLSVVVYKLQVDKVLYKELQVMMTISAQTTFTVRVPQNRGLFFEMQSLISLEFC